MKIDICDATILELNWLVAKCENERDINAMITSKKTDSRIIDPALYETIKNRENIRVDYDGTVVEGVWKAILTPNKDEPHFYYRYFGATPEIAVMRCYIGSRFGPDVEVPDELHTADSKSNGEQRETLKAFIHPVSHDNEFCDIDIYIIGKTQDEWRIRMFADKVSGVIARGPDSHADEPDGIFNYTAIKPPPEVEAALATVHDEVIEMLRVEPFQSNNFLSSAPEY